MTFQKELVEERLNKLAIERSVPRFHQDGIRKGVDVTGAVYEQQQRLDTLLEAFGNSVDRLNRVLEPVLAPNDKEPGRSEVRATISVPLADHLATRCETLDFLITKLNHTIGRVSI